tara:strand:- start:60 stop:221 length:162 start_codon:yes stop_codon:yes gene_type:complete
MGLVSLTVGMVIGTALGSVITGFHMEDIYTKQDGYALYCPNTGDFAWKVNGCD